MKFKEALNDLQIKKLKPKKKSYKKFDGEGLYLEITPSGGKLWKYKYRFHKKHKILSIGKYPIISLKEARDEQDKAQKLLMDSIDPMVNKKQKVIHELNTFKKIAGDWLDNKKPGWSVNYGEKIEKGIKKNLLPWLKDKPINKITTREILTVLKQIEARGATETAHRTGQIINQIFIFAIACDFLENNPASDIGKALKVHSTKNLAAITKPQEVGELMRAIDAFQGTFPVYSALRIAPLVFVRPGELRKAQWAEIDFKNNIWIIPSERMKMKREHIVPLSQQATDILSELHPLTGHGKFIFPSVRTDSRPMSENTLNAALRRLGYDKETMCAHGFRTMASTNLHEFGWKSEVIEMQLAHADKNKIRGIYNKAEYLNERTSMMQSWSDYLENLKSGAEIIPFKKGNNFGE